MKGLHSAIIAVAVWVGTANLVAAEEDDVDIILETKVVYDNWQNDFEVGDQGDVITESTKLALKAKNFLEDKDGFSVSVASAYVWSSVNRGDSSASFSHLSDTKVAIGYGRPFTDATWSWDLMANFNLPTGLTGTTLLQRLSKPSTGVSGSFLGAGFDAGLTATLSKKLEEGSKLSFGGGATRRGGYDPTEDIDGDNIDFGYQYTGFAGIEDLATDVATLAFGGKYTRGQGYAGKVSNSLSFSAGAKKSLADKRLHLSATYGFSYNDKQPDVPSAATREEEFVKGITNKFEAKVGYNIDKQKKWLLSGALAGSLGNQSQPVDETYFATNASLAGTGGITYQLGEESLSFASLKYAESGGDSSNGTTTHFSVWTGLVGVKLKF